MEHHHSTDSLCDNTIKGNFWNLVSVHTCLMSPNDAFKVFVANQGLIWWRVCLQYMSYPNLHVEHLCMLTVKLHSTSWLNLVSTWLNWKQCFCFPHTTPETLFSLTTFGISFLPWDLWRPDTSHTPTVTHTHRTSCRIIGIVHRSLILDNHWITDHALVWSLPKLQMLLRQPPTITNSFRAVQYDK